MSPVRESEAGSPERFEAEHEVQLELFRALRDAVAAGRERERIRELLDALIEYTSVHFMSEQIVMRLYDYPDYQAHVAEHDRLMAQVEELRRRFQEDGVRDLAELSDNVRDWLRHHMATHDRPWDRFLRRQRPD